MRSTIEILSDMRIVEEYVKSIAQTQKKDDTRCHGDCLGFEAYSRQHIMGKHSLLSLCLSYMSLANLRCTRTRRHISIFLILYCLFQCASVGLQINVILQGDL